MITDEQALSGKPFFYVSKTLRTYEVIKAWRSKREYKRTRSMSTFKARPGDILVRMRDVNYFRNTYTRPISPSLRAGFHLTIEEVLKYKRKILAQHNPGLAPFVGCENEYWGVYHDTGRVFLLQGYSIVKKTKKLFALQCNCVESWQNGIHTPMNWVACYDIHPKDTKDMTKNFWEARAAALNLASKWSKS